MDYVSTRFIIKSRSYLPLQIAYQTETGNTTTHGFEWNGHPTDTPTYTQNQRYHIHIPISNPQGPNQNRAVLEKKKSKGEYYKVFIMAVVN